MGKFIGAGNVHSSKSKIVLHLSQIEESKYENVYDQVTNRLDHVYRSELVHPDDPLAERILDLQDNLAKQNDVSLSSKDHPDVVRAFSGATNFYSQRDKVSLRQLTKGIEYAR